MKKVYSVIGLGKLGASMAAAIASRGFNVIGLDINQKNVDDVNSRHAPIQETDLEKIIQDNEERLCATTNWHDTILCSDVSFVIVPTPSKDNGSFSLEYAKNAFTEIGKVLKNKSKYHLIVLTSTVLPGSTRYGLLSILEKESGKICGKDFGLCYSPEFIALGSIIHDFLNPDFNLIGEFDKKSGDLLQQCYKEIMCNNPPCKRMTIENAELTKIALNTFVTTKITFANMLAELCNYIPDGDIDVITDALGSDTRIGRKYLTGGLGYGGPCFPRDNKALNYFANALGSSADIAEITDEINDSLTQEIGYRIAYIRKEKSIVAILGLAYKPLSSVIEQSQSIKLVEYLNDLGLKIIGYDPLVKEIQGNNMEIFPDIKECLQIADIVVIATPDKEFLTIDKDDFPINKKIIVYDCWRLLREKLNNVPNIKYFAFGIDQYPIYNKQMLKKLWQNND
jgi:UDPglucose 6-dehydrogenase